MTTTRENIRALVTRSRVEQGLPPYVVDELTLARVAEIFKRSDASPDTGEAA